jgi:GT2 family glycosyltransferase
MTERTSEARTTVVVATRNRCAELTATLGALAALRPRPPIIVVDNGSTDRTAAAVRAAADRFGDIHLVRLRANQGACARNRGVTLARTPYVAFADDDSWWATDALSRAERIFDEHPRLGLLAAHTLVGPEEHADPVSARMAASPLGQEPNLPGPSVLGFLACGAIVRRQAFLDVGGFSRLLHFGGEEELLAWDLAAAGWQLCHVDSVRAHHHPSPVRDRPLWRDVRQLRNRTLTTWMRRPARVGVRAGMRLLRRAPRYPPAGLAAAGAVARLPAALAHRRRLPDDVERRIRTLDAATGPRG